MAEFKSLLVNRTNLGRKPGTSYSSMVSGIPAGASSRVEGTKGNVPGPTPPPPPAPPPVAVNSLTINSTDLFLINPTDKLITNP